MIYQYIHTVAGTAYRDMPVETPFPQNYIDDVKNLCCYDSFLSHHSPGVFSYFSLGDSGTSPLVVMSKTAKKDNSASVAFYAQSIGWEWDGNLLLNGMNTIFDHVFYSEDEIDRYTENEASVPTIIKTAEESADAASQVEVDPRAAKAVLYAILSKWLRGSAPVIITVPEGVDYNSYVLSAVKQLYSYFPVGLRTEAGFASYLCSEIKRNPRIYIIFTPQSGIPDSVSLDGSSETAIQKLISAKTGYTNLNNVVEYLCSLNAEERKAFISGLYGYIEGQYNPPAEYKVTARSYLSIGDAIEIIQKEGAPATLIADWIRYYCNRNEYPPFLQERIEQRITQTLTGEDLYEYLRNCFANLTPSDTVARFAACNALFKADPRFAAAAQRALTAVLDGAAIGDEDRLKLLENNMSQLDTVITEEMLLAVKQRIFAAMVLSFAAKLKDIKSIPTETQQQIDNVSTKTVALLREVEASPAAEACVGVKRDIEQYINALGEKSDAIIKQGFEDKFRTIHSAEPQTVAQIEGVLGRAYELKNAIECSPAALKLQDLTYEIDLYILSLQEKKDSSDAAFAELKEKLDAVQSYFDAQIVLGENLQTIAKLDEKKRDLIYHQANTQRPEGASDYAAAFETRYGKPLTLAAIAALPPYVCSRVAEDICALGIKPLSLSSAGASADELRDKTVGNIAVARAVSDNCKAALTLNNSPCDAGVLLPLLSLTYKGDDSSAKRTFYDLVKAGVYSSTQLCAAISMVGRCEWNYEKLMKCILEGKFSGCSGDDYTTAFELIVRQLKKSSAKNDPLDFLKSVNDSMNGKSDATAHKALSAFISRQKRAGEKRSFFVPFIIAGVLCLVVAVLSILLLFTPVGNFIDHSDPPEAVSILNQTPEEIVAPAFSHYSAVVKSAVLSEETADAYEATYAAHQSDETYLTLNGDAISWNEYFFWYCYLCAEKGVSPSDGTFTSMGADVDGLLTMLHPKDNEQIAEGTVEPEDAVDAEGTASTKTTAGGKDLNSQLDKVIETARRSYGEAKSLILNSGAGEKSQEKYILNIAISRPTEPAKTESEVTEPEVTEPVN